MSEASLKAERAAQLLDDPMLKEAFAIIERDIFEMWVACPERDIEGQKLLQQHIRNARKLKGILLAVIDNGKLEIFNKQGLAEKAMNAFRRQ